MRRDEFEDCYGTLRDEGLTPEEIGLRRRRPRADEDDEPPAQWCIWCGERCAADQQYCSIGCAIEAERD